MAKVRVYELAKELGTDSKQLLQVLKDDGEYLRSASSTLEHPVVRRMRAKFQTSPEAFTTPRQPPATRPDRRPAPATTPHNVVQLAKRYHVPAATMGSFLAEHGITTNTPVPAAVVDELKNRLIVNTNTSGPAQLLLMPGRPLADVAQEAPEHTAREHKEQEEQRRREELARAEQERHRLEAERPRRLWLAAQNRWNARVPDVSRQVRSPQWATNPGQLRSLSTRWSQVHLVDHHKALLKGLTATRAKACGMHPGAHEALADAQLFWMPQASVTRINYRASLPLEDLVPRDLSTGLVAFESLVPLSRHETWLSSDVPGVRDHAFRSILWFIDDDTVHIIGWRHVHPLAVNDPDGVEPAITTYLGRLNPPRPVWTTDELLAVYPSWPWIPTTHFSQPLNARITLTDIPNPDHRACLAALTQTWHDLAATRRPPRPRTERAPGPRPQGVEEAFEEHRLIAPGTRFVQLTRTSHEVITHMGPDRQTQRTYHFSWMVRGHKRRQHYGPGGSEIKIIDIAPHMRGPHGAPMLGPKVYLLPPPR